MVKTRDTKLLALFSSTEKAMKLAYLYLTVWGCSENREVEHD
jgi:hypothetical protein